jgi:hypothetical protein
MLIEENIYKKRNSLEEIVDRATRYAKLEVGDSVSFHFN